MRPRRGVRARRNTVRSQVTKELTKELLGNSGCWMDYTWPTYPELLAQLVLVVSEWPVGICVGTSALCTGVLGTDSFP